MALVAIVAIAPGNAPVFTATPTPSGSAIAAGGVVPTWTSSDTTNAPVTADATGLIGTVNIPTSAVVGTSFTLSVSYVNPDGVTATGSATFTIVSGGTTGSTDVTGFSIVQTA